MPRQQISEDLKTFITKHVNSVFGLETLLLLHRHQGQTFTAAGVAQELGFAEDVAQDQLSRLAALGLFRETANVPGYVYQPHDRASAQLVDRLAVAYSQQRVPILSLILSERSNRIRLFAEAFRIIRGSD